MHSWRVLLLPYLDEADLHGAYRFDEPWNGPNNSKLAGSIPNVFRCPSFDDAAFVGLEDSSVMSNYLCITGSQTAFPGTASVATAEILDGPSETVVVTEVKQHSVHWMQPKDIPAESAYEYLKSGDHTHIGGAQFLFGDGSVRFIQEDVPLTIFERLLSIADGDPVGKF
jgi:prepilin-type processing-associated H-X9-DG protein